MKILIFHLTGNANVKSAVYGFIEKGLLGKFYVSIASLPGSLIDKLGKFGPLSEIRRRRFEPILKQYIRTWPWWEAGRIIALKFKLTKLTNNVNAPFYIDKVVKNLDKHVSDRLAHAQKNGVNCVYGYEDTTLFTFRKARKLGMHCLYDLPIGYWRAAHQLLSVEQERWPDWINTMPGLKDSEEKLSRKDEELSLADKIFVASTFTANTLKFYPGKLSAIKVIPYGFPPVTTILRHYDDFENDRPVKLLFVGSLSQRKGIADLFEAVKNIGNKVMLTVVGSKTTEHCKPLNEALTAHRWIPSLAHHEVLALMRESDVLVFPSLFEGFGLVITEAMSQGTPVITTERTAGPDLIDHGKDGWLVKAGCTVALQSAIEALVSNPSSIAEAGKAAMVKASLRPWQMYGAELAAAAVL